MAEDSGMEHDHKRAHHAEREVARPASEQAAPTGLEQVVGSGALLGDARLNGRGNQPVKIATMQHAQGTHGNRAVQRMIQRSTSLPVQREDPPAAPAPAQAPAAQGSNAVTAALWASAVEKPIAEAAKDLQNNPNKGKISTALEKLTRARGSVRDVRSAYPEDAAANATIRARLANVANIGLAEERGLMPHAGQLKPVPDLQGEIEGLAALAGQVGQEVSSTPPAQPPPSNSTQPASGAAPAAPGPSAGQ